MDSEARLRLVTDAAGLAIEDTPTPLPSDSNDAWKIGELVLRICWRGDRTRLHREAVILEHLPDEVPHVRLADAGVTKDLTWTLTHWIPGTRLSDLWADLDTAQRRGAAAQLAHTLEALHDWEPSPQVRDAIAARPPQRDTSERVGADLNPLPVDRALLLIEPAMRLDNLGPRSVAQLGEAIEHLQSMDPLGDPTEGVVVHGDLNLNNVVMDGDRLVALLDYEWARLGPPDLDLQPLIQHETGSLVRWIVDSYPGIADHPNFVVRLWLYDLAANLRDLHVKAPLPETDDLPPWHPKRRLEMILAGPGYIEALLDDNT